MCECVCEREREKGRKWNSIKVEKNTNKFCEFKHITGNQICYFWTFRDN